MPIRRRKFHGLYFHSSAPRVVTMKARGQDNETTREAIVIKPSNIRIWIHDKDIGKLTQVLWEGQGNRLRTEICSNNRVKKFLDAVPYVMNVIKQTHTAVVENNLDELINITSPPVPKGLLSSKDVNGLTPLHKAAGLGHLAIVEYILRMSPSTATDIDATGKTPLHWASTLEIYNKLVQAGADELACDYRMKTANFYRSKSSELHKSFLTVIPESPRVPQSGLPPNYDWAMFDEEHNYQLIRNNFVRKSHSTYGSFNTLVGSDDRNHGSAELIPNMRDDESESNDAEMQNEIETMDDGEPEVNGKGDNENGDENHETMDQSDEPENENEVAEPEAEPDESHDVENGNGNGLEENDESTENPEQNDADADADADADTDADADNQTEMENGDAQEEDEAEPEENGDHEEADLQSGDEADSQNDEEQPEADIENGEESNEMQNGGDHNDEDQEENGKNEESPITSEHQSPRVDERIDSAENREILIIDHGDDPNEQNMNDEHEGIEHQPHDAEDDDNHITTIEASEIENFNDMDDVPDLEYEEEVPMNSKPGMAMSTKSSAKTQNSAASLRSAQSAKSTKSAKSATSATSAKSAKSTASATSAANATSAKSTRSTKSMTFENGSENGSKPGTAEVPSKPNSAAISTKSVASAKSRRSNVSSAASRKGSAQSNQSQKIEEGQADGAEPMESVEETNKEAEIVENETESENVEGNGNDDEYGEVENTNEPDGNDATEEAEQHDNDTTDTNQEEQEEHQQPQEETNNNEENKTAPEPVENETSENAETNDESNAKDANDPVMEIEGIVHGEADNNVVQSASRFSAIDNNDNKNYMRAQSIIDKQDMEQLAAMVLNGDGQYLIGSKSSQPEIQAFIDNVPAYMNKIRRVHVAAREGSLRDLQSALDRRKFAIAKDDCSPGKCTPIHVATIFGHASILRYLGGRFPETTSSVDENGRTALHYAATIKDNGHFYNLLVHLGSNPNAIDKLGHNAEFYLDHDKTDKILSHAELLRQFGVASSAADGMLNDQVPDDLHSARREIDDIDVLSTLERCFRIIHDASKPAGNNSVESVPRKLHPKSVPGSATSASRISSKAYLARFLKRSIFDKIKARQTRIDHNLFDVIWPAMKKRNTLSSNPEFELSTDGGIVAPDLDVFVVFQEFLVPLIKDLHCIDINSDFHPHPETQYFPANRHNENTLSENVDVDTSNEIAGINLDKGNKYVRACVIEVSRNLERFELPLNLTVGPLEQVERIITARLLSTDFSRTIEEKELGVYYTMNEVLENGSEIRTILAAKGLLIPLLSNDDPYQKAESIAINGRFWPYGRGVFVNASYDFVAWINCQEHLRILCCTNSNTSANIGRTYVKIGKAIMYLTEQIEFRNSYFLGYLAARPSFLGTSLRIYLTLDLPHLIKEPDNLQHLCNVRGLRMSLPLNSTYIRVSNLQALSVTEWKIFQDFCTAVANIIQLEKDLSIDSSNHIASMLMSIFRKKRNSFDTDTS